MLLIMVCAPMGVYYVLSQYAADDRRDEIIATIEAHSCTQEPTP